MIYYRILNIVPRALHRTLMFIHPIGNSLHLLIPHPIPPLPFSPLAHKSVLYVGKPVSVL